MRSILPQICPCRGAGTFMRTTLPRTSSVGTPGSGSRRYSSAVYSGSVTVDMATPPPVWSAPHFTPGPSFSPVRTASGPAENEVERPAAADVAAGAAQVLQQGRVGAAGLLEGVGEDR